jgi:2TM domain
MDDTRLPDPETEDVRKLALERLKKKSDFRTHLLVYVLVNAMLIGIWAATGTGFFWPIFVILGWGIGVVLNGWDVYRRPFPTQAQIEHEIEAIERDRAEEA